MSRLIGKVVLVTGSATGLGTAQAVACAREGAKVVLGDIADRDGAQVEAQIRSAGAEAVYVHLDVTNEDEWRAAIRTTVDRFGKLNVLINNAGIVIRKVPIEERTAEEWDRVMAVNLRGVFLGTKQAIPELRRAGGRIDHQYLFSGWNRAIPTSGACLCHEQSGGTHVKQSDGRAARP